MRTSVFQCYRVEIRPLDRIFSQSNHVHVRVERFALRRVCSPRKEESFKLWYVLCVCMCAMRFCVKLSHVTMTHFRNSLMTRRWRAEIIARERNRILRRNRKRLIIARGWIEKIFRSIFWILTWCYSRFFSMKSF